VPPSPFARSLRGTIAALTVAIVGVLALDATAIVAAPRTSVPLTSSPAMPATSNSQLRLIYWSGGIWLVFPDSSNGPDGPHTLSDSTKAAYVDAKGRLHLAATKVGGKWRGVQLESLNPLNYGTYSFVTATSVAKLARPLVLGMFIYRPSDVRYTNEIDLEDSRSLTGLGYPRDAQYVVQPYTVKSHIHRYDIRRSVTVTRQQFTWKPGRVTFVTRAGRSATARRLSHFSYSGSAVPQPANEHVYINLHLHTKHAPGKGTRRVILDSFSDTGPGK
jgi:hypothetical protein